MTTNKKTRSEVARALGVTGVSVHRICRGEQTPSPALAEKLESLTGVPAWEWVKPAKETAA